MNTPMTHRVAIPKREQGVILIIALIMLVAMTLAGIILFRQIGAGVIIARNLTFRQGATIGADRGIEMGRAWIMGQAQSALEQANVGAAYFPAWCNISVNASNRPDANNDGNTDDCGTSPPPSEFTPASFNWANAVQAVADDGAGNEIRYVIHRLCRIPGSVNSAGQQCVTKASADNANCPEANATCITATAQPYYRITARARGPLGTTSYTQAILY